PPAWSVRVREERVGALDDERPQPLGMIEENLLGNEGRRERPEVAEGRDRGDAGGERLLLPVSTARLAHRGEERLEEDVAAWPPDVAGEGEEHADQVGDEGRERRLLDAEIVKNCGRLRL